MRDEGQPAVLIGGEGEAGLDIVSAQIGKVIEHLRNAHAAPQIVENVGDSDANPHSQRECGYLRL